MYPLGRTNPIPSLALVLDAGSEGGDADVINVGSLALNRNLAVEGESALSSLDVEETLTVAGDSQFSNVEVSGDLAVAGAFGLSSLSLSGTLTVTGDSQLANAEVTGDASVAGTLGLQDLEVGGTLAVTGNSQLSNAELTGDLSVTGNSTVTNLNVGEDLSVTGSIQVSNIIVGTKLNLTKGGELTIASGAITLTGSFHEVDTEGDAVEDDLVTINGGANGDLLILRPANAARDVRLRSSGNILVDDGTLLGNSILGTMLLFDGSLNAWLVLAPSAAGQVLAYRIGHKFRLGTEAAPTYGTANAVGGTLVGTSPLLEGYAYNVSVTIHGKQATTNYAFSYLGRATVFRPVGGNALLVEGTNLEIQKTLFDTSDGSSQDASAIEVVIDTSTTAVRVTVTNNHGSNNLAMTSAGIAIGMHQYALEPNP